ncbi:uncharacterized protein LOC130630483 [Hydractinia symbiolongicarpus]|uniref:uncharacterized protein LOC130630483 n=1 Tax=Hydractinia symbiolongicarpus TaxID=13093 RepID=UPI00254D6691|nr:uncharacterized protein LOC130630483 [Hydractinia symbiolongicarpus]
MSTDYRKTHNPHWNLPVPGRYNHIHRIGNAASGYDDLEYVWLINESEYNQLRGREDRPYVGRKQHLKHPSSYFHYNDYTGNGERKGLDLRRKKEEQVNFKTFQASKVEKQNVSSSGNSVKTGTAGDIHDNVNLSSKYKHTDEQNSLTASGFKNASKTKKKAAANAQQEARVEKEEEVLVGKEKDKADGNAQDAGYKVEKEKTTKEEGSTRNEEEDEDDFLDDACKKITECVADVHEKCRHLFDRRISICAVPMNNLFSKKKVINLGELCKGKPSETWLVVRNFEHGTRFLDQKSTSGVYCGTLDGQKIVM